jgi:hypothetical protein
VLFTGQQDVKQPTDCTVGAVYWSPGCETANRLLLVLFTAQQYVKQPTGCTVGAVYCSAGCETANRL